MSLPKVSATTLLEPVSSIKSTAPVSPISTKSFSPQTMQKTGTSSSFLASFLDSSPSQQQQRSPTTLFRHDKRWRWWNFISIFTILLIIFQVTVLCKGYKDLLNRESSAIRIGKTNKISLHDLILSYFGKTVKRQYPFKAYTHLDTNIQSQIEKGTQVYHVTKEFGPAVTSQLGRTVTALAAAQQASNLTEVAIVMPFYTFMRRLITDKEIDMVLDIRGKRPGQIMTVEFRVWKMMHAFNPPVQLPSKYEWQMINNVNTSVLITPQRPAAPTDVVPVYMIGHANRKPFNQAFKCRTVNDIHTENELPNEWRDQYFAKAAAAFLAHKATASDEESIFAPIRIVPRVDIVHIHGASNAYVAKFLQDKKEADDLGPRPPAIVYTMHDHQEEIQYYNSFRSVRKFLENLSEREALRKYVYGGKMFMTKLAIDRADAVTFSSRPMAADIVEGRRDFHLKELVMDGLLKKVEGSRFYGISNAIDYYSSEHPFITDKLIDRNMGYPQYALDMIKDQTLIHSKDPLHALALDIPDTPTYWTFSESPNDFTHVYKDRAKRYLIKRSLFNEEDMKRPVVLFRGNFEMNKGLDIFDKAAEYFVKNNMRFVIMGHKRDYPFEKLEVLQKLYPHHVSLISTPKEQRQLGIFCRAAADFVFAPNPNDSLGLETVEGMVFGSAAITTGAGSLHESIIDRPLNKTGKRRVNVAYLDPTVISEKGAVVTSYEYFNGYVYDHEEPLSLESAIQDAAIDFQKTRKNKALREEYILRMIRSALNLGWDRGHFQGPVHEYNQVYELALEDRLIPEMRRHEVEQEHELVSRLQDVDVDLLDVDWE
jgi:glycogen synthase